LAASLLLALAKVIEKFDPRELLDAVDGRTELLSDRLYAMLYDCLALLPLYGEVRLKFGDHCLAERGIKVVAGAQRGQTIPEGTALTALKPVGFLREGDGNWIRGTQVQERALDESGPCYAPWGRDLLWRVFNNKEGEGDAFLGTLDKSKYYVFAGDRDLQDSDGVAVLLYLYCDEDVWGWLYDYVGRGYWDAHGQLLALGNSSI
jgi:hypothetical protein